MELAQPSRRVLNIQTCWEQMVAVANDITFNSGAFSPREDAVFRAVTEYALEERLPLLYLAANSGARVGLANEVKKNLQACHLLTLSQEKNLAEALT